MEFNCCGGSPCFRVAADCLLDSITFDLYDRYGRIIVTEQYESTAQLSENLYSRIRKSKIKSATYYYVLQGYYNSLEFVEKGGSLTIMR